jgi:hypothetical protein
MTSRSHNIAMTHAGWCPMHQPCAQVVVAALGAQTARIRISISRNADAKTRPSGPRRGDP